MISLEHYLVLSGVLFCVGLFGTLTKRHMVTVLMSLELMFNAVVIAMVAFSKFTIPSIQGEGFYAPMVLSGQIFSLFVITVAAAELALGLALVIAIYRHKESVDITQVDVMKG